MQFCFSESDLNSYGQSRFLKKSWTLSSSITVKQSLGVFFCPKGVEKPNLFPIVQALTNPNMKTHTYTFYKRLKHYLNHFTSFFITALLQQGNTVN